ncbi:prepilin-type N-terminal cleavage/methylation domain-containing protein [Candidatus Saccharibacteria bacterium]|nr:MAG: prepilin-type N-terminal cleavage/methylation domain-containing protein [Candidatus Saccharibacteria bacterium]
MRKTLQQRKESGFTIIEVLIVLAIAGLIMLIVFLAVPTLQRNARNNARNSEASRISALITDCLANRNGVTASCQSDANTGYTAGDFQQLTALTYGAGAGSTTAATVQYAVKCNVDGSGTAAGSARDFAVRYVREPAIARCIGSQ